MPTREDLLRAARETREKAAQVRRLVQAISLKVDQAKMRQQERELEAEARRLEQLAAARDPVPANPSGPPVQRQQVQQQQQHQAEPDTTGPKGSGRKP